MPLQEPTPAPARRPGRRTALALITFGAGVGALAGCSTPPPSGLGRRMPQPTRDTSPDAVARATAITWARHLRDRGLRERGGRASSTIDDVVTHHLLHLAALGDVEASAPTGPPPAPLVPPRTTPAITPRPAAGTRALADDEARAAAAALASCTGSSPGLATLLARIAAARCVHAVRLAGPRPVRALLALEPAGPFTSADAAVLQDVLAGAHAAVYAYGVVVSRSEGARRATARAHADEHERTVELLQRRLRAAGVEPVAALPGYRLPDLRGSDAAARLARRVESGTGRLTASAVGAARGEAARTLSARLLARAAVRARAWGDQPALPGA